MWRVQYTLAKTRTAARRLVNPDDKDKQEDPFQVDAVLRHMRRLGVLGETKTKLDRMLGVATAKILE